MNVLLRIALSLLLMMVCVSGAKAATIYFSFSTNVDATDFGLTAAEPLTIEYSYNTATVGNTITPNNVIYPMGFAFTLGTFSVQAAYGAINTRIPPAFSFA